MFCMYWSVYGLYFIVCLFVVITICYGWYIFVPPPHPKQKDHHDSFNGPEFRTVIMCIVGCFASPFFRDVIEEAQMGDVNIWLISLMQMIDKCVCINTLSFEGIDRL